MTTPATDPTRRAPRLGLRATVAQFSLLVAVNALVGGMLGQERTVLPLLAEREFGLTAYTSALTFILAFGATKAATNYVAGTLSDRYGRKPVLVAGWLFALPVPLLLIWAPATSPRATGCGPGPSSSASPSPHSAWGCPHSRCARPATTPASKPPPTPAARTGATTTCTGD